MDFTLSLTHFCEVHGPKSILCTQVLPLECARCLAPSPTLRSRRSTESFTTQVHSSGDEGPAFTPPALRKTNTNLTLPTDFSGASTTVDSEPGSPSIERHPLFKAAEEKDLIPQFRYGTSQGETCASCSFSVPQAVADKLPAGAPGSTKSDGKTKNGAPVLRSREMICLGGSERAKRRRANPEPGSSQESTASSFQSFQSGESHRNCHDHKITYLTGKSPEDPESYALLRASVIRTLSCELLPRGMSDGPLCFGDSNTGYTIAYVFRLTDPRARGRRRVFAFVALAGKDASRAFRACPMLWEAFAAMAKGIEQAAQRYQEEQKQKEDEARESGKSRNYTPVSSFLTQRAVDPDGHPRRAGQTTPRSLAEIVGDENIFAILHQYFVAVLRCLGDKFGGLPLADISSVYQTLADNEGVTQDPAMEQAHNEMIQSLGKLRDDDATPTPTPQAVDNDVDAAKARINKKVQRNSQCGPISVSTTAQRQVVV